MYGGRRFRTPRVFGNRILSCQAGHAASAPPLAHPLRRFVAPSLRPFPRIKITKRSRTWASGAKWEDSADARSARPARWLMPPTAQRLVVAGVRKFSPFRVEEWMGWPVVGGGAALAAPPLPYLAFGQKPLRDSEVNWLRMSSPTPGPVS